MTCIEQLRQKHPEWTDDQIHDFIRAYCPWEVGIDYPPERVCRHSRCSECWDTDIPEPKKIKKEKKTMPTHNINGANKMTKAELIEEIRCAYDHIHAMETQIKNLERYKQYEDLADEMKAMHTAFMNSGFTNEQAYDLMKTLLNTFAPIAFRGM